MVQIFGRMTSNNVQKVVWLLDELNVPYKQHDYGGPFGNTQTTQYLAMNPHGTVPTMVDGGLVLWESNTILRYIANKYPSVLYPGEIAARAHVEKWMDWQLGTLSPAFRPLYIALVRNGKTAGETSGEHDVAMRQFDLLERALGTGSYMTGEHLTLADIAIGPMLYRWFKLGLDGSRGPQLKALLGRLGAMPAFEKVVFREMG